MVLMQVNAIPIQITPQVALGAAASSSVAASFGATLASSLASSPQQDRQDQSSDLSSGAVTTVIAFNSNLHFGQPTEIIGTTSISTSTRVLLQNLTGKSNLNTTPNSASNLRPCVSLLSANSKTTIKFYGTSASNPALAPEKNPPTPRSTLPTINVPLLNTLVVTAPTIAIAPVRASVVNSSSTQHSFASQSSLSLNTEQLARAPQPTTPSSDVLTERNFPGTKNAKSLEPILIVQNNAAPTAKTTIPILENGKLSAPAIRSSTLDFETSDSEASGSAASDFAALAFAASAEESPNTSELVSPVGRIASGVPLSTRVQAQHFVSPTFSSPALGTSTPIFQSPDDPNQINTGGSATTFPMSAVAPSTEPASPAFTSFPSQMESLKSSVYVSPATGQPVPSAPTSSRIVSHEALDSAENQSDASTPTLETIFAPAQLTTVQSPPVPATLATALSKYMPNVEQVSSSAVSALRTMPPTIASYSVAQKTISSVDNLFSFPANNPMSASSQPQSTSTSQPSTLAAEAALLNVPVNARPTEQQAVPKPEDAKPLDPASNIPNAASSSVDNTAASERRITPTPSADVALSQTDASDSSAAVSLVDAPEAATAPLNQKSDIAAADNRSNSSPGIVKEPSGAQKPTLSSTTPAPISAPEIDVAHNIKSSGSTQPFMEQAPSVEVTNDVVQGNNTSSLSRPPRSDSISSGVELPSSTAIDSTSSVMRDVATPPASEATPTVVADKKPLGANQANAAPSHDFPTPAVTGSFNISATPTSAVSSPAAPAPALAPQVTSDPAPDLPQSHQMMDSAPPAPSTPPDATPSTSPAETPINAQMHVGLRTDAFGTVEIHTVVQQSQVGITVHSDHDISRWFNSEVPGLESGLTKSHLNLTAVNFDNGRSGVQTATSFQQGQHKQNFTQNSGVAYAALAAKDAASDSPTIDVLPSDTTVGSAITRMSIHA